MAKIIKIITSHPVALDSPDYHHPWGTKRDNTVCPEFWMGLQYIWKRPFNFLDLGCAAGGLALESYQYGNLGVGIEGGDYWVRHIDENEPGSLQWKQNYGACLFTCDISHPFTVVEADIEPPKEKTFDLRDIQFSHMKFEVISAWEVLEHLNTARIPIFFKNIADHLTDDGMFLASISLVDDAPEGVSLHQTVKDTQWWMEQIAATGLFKIPEPFPFYEVKPPRIERDSIFIMLRKK